MSLRPVDVKTSIVRAPEHPQPQARDSGAAATQYAIARQARREAEQQQQTVRASRQAEDAPTVRDGSAGGKGARDQGTGGRRRQAAAPAPAPREPGKGARIDFKC